MRFLIGECLHTSLVQIAHDFGHEGHHVVYLGLQGWQDLPLMRRVLEQGYTLVTNNAIDFPYSSPKYRPNNSAGCFKRSWSMFNRGNW